MSESDTITIFERSREGRRAFVAPAPEDEVPELAIEELLPEGARRERPAELPEVSEPELVRHYTTLSSKNFHLDEGFYPLGSCTMKHNPKLHERVAALPGPRAPAPAAGPGARAGRARADVAPAGGARGGRRPAARLAAAERRLARRARRAAAHARLPRGPRRAAHEGPDPGHGARHQPGDGDDGRLRGGQGRHGAGRRRRPRRPARQGGRGRRLPDAHEPEHARPVRHEHRGDRADRARAWGRRSTTTGPT